MVPWILFFALATGWVQWQAELPSPVTFAVCAVLGIVTQAGWWYRRGYWVALVGAFLLGIAWAGWMAQWRLEDGLADALEGRDLQIVGVIDDLPQRFENGWRFDFHPESAPAPLPEKISLAWYRGFRVQDDPATSLPPAIRAGERWRLTVRIKKPHGNANPEGFDYEGWLFERGVRATGYVRSSDANQRLDTFVPGVATFVARLRQNIRDRALARLGDRPYAGILVALAVGDQQAIDNRLWSVFSRTGLTHLMSISGLHITLVAGLGYGLVNFLWRRSRHLSLRLPAQQAAALAGALTALGYCLLAGFAVPAQRTLYMLSVAAAALWLRRELPARKVLAAALFVVLVFDPWAMISAGFWLSFSAVSLLFLIGSGRIAPAHWLREWGRAQWAMSIGLLPLLLALFQQFSLVSPLANAVAIPLVSFVITPLVLLGAIPGLEFLLLPAHGITAWLMALVDVLAASPLATWQQHAPPAWAVLVAVAGIVWLLLPRGFPARWMGAVLCLPLFFIPPQRPGYGAVRVVVLDVGQGLAVHVQTATRDLLFDTGPAFSPDANSGNRLILPYLRAAGVERLDALVVSHQDKDHSGGAESVLAGIPVDELYSSLPADHPLRAATLPQFSCHAGQTWEWDGVRFQMLHPMARDYANRPRKTNDMSCVLRVASTGASALISADIEAVDEASLLARDRSSLAADVLVAPHHGSRTSSTPDFLAAVHPRDAVFTVGYRNRFGHPRADILARYTGITLHRSDRDGAVSFDLGNAGNPAVAVVRERERRRRYWQGH
ncbi:MAG: DNA internalization-related competence protein ComEC/Rec2 [Proteobacteria bacterium]|nr:DNA internalization-related competence protein ComEC/Rec2 [Pseudomonadota bacterium]HQR03229.1 DNA internalization-related competence protein ComEC/Rec2 [Rhodocyclaceae bacterium]